MSWDVLILVGSAISLVGLLLSIMAAGGISKWWAAPGAVATVADLAA